MKDIEIMIEYWKDSSDQDFLTMQNLIKSGDYNWALFIGHLVLEKLLKALLVKHSGQQAIMTHDLLRLADKAGIDITPQYVE